MGEWGGEDRPEFGKEASLGWEQGGTCGEGPRVWITQGLADC